MINSNIKINENIIKENYNNAPDITLRYLEEQKEKITIVFNQSLCSTSSINESILRNITLLTNKKTFFKKDLYTLLKKTLAANNVKEVNTYKEIYSKLSNGFTIILFDKKDKALAVETKQDLSRAISEPLTEQTISGPKDAFNENYMTNIGLVRKRIKTDNLKIKEKILGRESKTKVSIMYMDNIIEKNLLDELNKKLESIDIDGIIDSTYIKELILKKDSIFPLLETTERPDHATMSLLEGRILIFVENSPYAIIIPTFFFDFFHAPEDNYQNYKNVTFTRLIRFFAFFIATQLPAIYVAVTTYNQEAIPTTLITNFAAQRAGVPFPAIVEALGMILIFEVLRESDIRMPNFSGSAISILGAIVLGDAAVSAGIVSPIMLIMIATSAICSLMYSNVGMINAIRIWRIIFMIFATIFGIPGVFLADFIFIINLCELKSLGKPYLYPITPFSFKFLKRNVGKSSIRKDNERSPILTDKNYKRSNL